MGLISDFFVASREAAIDYANSGGSSPDRLSGRAEHRGLNGLHLSALWAVLLGEPMSLSSHGMEAIASGEDDDIWTLERIPAPMVNRLAALDASQIGDLAVRWSQSAEVDIADEDALAVLQDLYRLAGDARAAAEGLYLWCAM